MRNVKEEKEPAAVRGDTMTKCVLHEIPEQNKMLGEREVNLSKMWALVNMGDVSVLAHRS